jgi:hypothetical protein
MELTQGQQAREIQKLQCTWPLSIIKFPFYKCFLNMEVISTQSMTIDKLHWGWPSKISEAMLKRISKEKERAKSGILDIFEQISIMLFILKIIQLPLVFALN